jgi:hypothetical protein
MADPVDPEVGARLQVNVFLFSGNVAERFSREELEKINKAANVYLSFFVPQVGGKTPAERAGIMPPQWLAELLPSFREEPLAKGEAEDAGFFYADFMSGLLLDWAHGAQSKRARAIQTLAENLSDPSKARSLEDAQRKVYAAASKARQRLPEYKEKEPQVVTPFLLAYEMSNPRKVAAILDALDSIEDATIQMGEFGVFKVVKQQQEEGHHYSVCAFPQGGVFGLRVGIIRLEGNFLLVSCSTEFRKRALTRFLTISEFENQLKFLHEAKDVSRPMPNEDDKTRPFESAPYNAKQHREEAWAGKHYFELQKKAGMPYIAVRDRKVVAAANTIHELLEKVKGTYGEPKVAKQCPFVTEQVDVLNLVYDDFMVLIPTAPRSQRDGSRMLDAEWNALGMEVGRHLAEFQGELLRLFGMHQLTAQDIIRALRARFNIRLTEEELYELAKRLFKMTEDMYPLMMNENNPKPSDTWLLLAEKEYCLVADSSSGIIMAARRGSDKVKLLGEAIRLTKHAPSTLITKGVRDMRPLAEVCPSTFIQSLESAEIPHHAATARGIIHDISYIIKIRSRGKEDIGWLLPFAVINHNVAPKEEKISDAVLSMADLKGSDEPPIPPDMRKFMEERGLTTIDELNAWAEKQPKPWLSGIWQATLWPAGSLGLQIEDWHGEEGYLALIADAQTQRRRDDVVKPWPCNIIEESAEPFILAAKLGRTKEEAINAALETAYAFANHKAPKVIQTIHPEDYEEPTKRLFGSSVKVEYLPP